MTFKRPPALATVIMLIAVGILCALGLWQVKRLEWKRDLLASIDAAYLAPAVMLQTGKDLLLEQEKQGQPFFLRAAIKGEFLTNKSIHIIPRVHDGVQGFHLLTPMQLDDGTILIVNRGWIPSTMDQSDFRTKMGSQIITGLIRYPDRANIFTPHNIPSENHWYTINIDEIGRYLVPDKTVLPFVFYPEVSDGEYPVALGAKPTLNNNHLSYAMFWFGMALVLISVFVLRFMVIYRDIPPAAGEISP